jgi:hypothetical protein
MGNSQLANCPKRVLEFLFEVWDLKFEISCGGRQQLLNHLCFTRLAVILR